MLALTPALSPAHSMTLTRPATTLSHLLGEGKERVCSSNPLEGSLAVSLHPATEHLTLPLPECGWLGQMARRFIRNSVMVRGGIWTIRAGLWVRHDEAATWEGGASPKLTARFGTLRRCPQNHLAFALGADFSLVPENFQHFRIESGIGSFDQT